MAYPLPVVPVDDAGAITVGIAHDNQMVRAGFRRVVERDAAFEVVEGPMAGVRDLVFRHRPRVLVLDLRPDVEDTIGEVLLAAPGTRILLLADSAADDAGRSGLSAGASGVLVRRPEPLVLLGSLHVIASGETLLCPVSSRHELPLPPSQSAQARLRLLTVREHQVLRHVVAGLGNAAIGKRLFVSESAVKTHVSNILTKLRLENRVQAALLGYQSGLYR